MGRGPGWKGGSGRKWWQGKAGGGTRDEEECPYLPVIFEGVSSGSKVRNGFLTVWAPCMRGRERMLPMWGRLRTRGPSWNLGRPSGSFFPPTDCGGSSDSHHLHTSLFRIHVSTLPLKPLSVYVSAVSMRALQGSLCSTGPCPPGTLSCTLPSYTQPERLGSGRWSLQSCSASSFHRGLPSGPGEPDSG